MSDTQLHDIPVLPDYVQPPIDGLDSGVLKGSRDRKYFIRLFIYNSYHLCTYVVSVCLHSYCDSHTSIYMYASINSCSLFLFMLYS